MLNTIVTGEPTAKPAVLIVHGLFGSARNWGVISKRLSDRGQVLAVDMRNHGQSPWHDTNSYDDMAGDLAEVIEHHGAPMDVVGHSMGGKAAMVLALTRPDLIRRLTVADIAPTAYDHDQRPLIVAMRGVDLTSVETRSDADAQLKDSVPEDGTRAFLLQSLDRKEHRWRLNLDVLDREMDGITGFPDIDASTDTPTLFLSGAESHYVRPEHRDRIKALFPQARFAKIPGAGHWLHADKPREFEAALRTWLDA
ncbi:alpha/beta fold hydrolase [Pseudoruegeria sp. HB172150]|uniref:alpha/beta fold hydrolase n=1 Tax=Pseudoruegeria sp. HB172150 TaxID=2721164 RepID=UPI0015521C37|nr:alpha/beta fold hydrolase [Pseudoruegeria sp. HB172150]